MVSKVIDNSQWFLIYTKAQQEQRAKKNLECQGFETFLPMIALFGGCRAYTVEFEQSYCSDVNLSDPGDPEIWFVEDGDDMLILRSHAFVSSDALFDPVVEIDASSVFGRVKFQVEEFWKDLGTSKETSCIAPTLRVLDAVTDSFSVEWYEGDLGGATVAVGAN